MQEALNIIEIELNPELSEDPAWSLQFFIEVLLEAIVAAEPTAAASMRNQLVDLIYKRAASEHSARKSENTILWSTTPHRHVPGCVEIVTHAKGDASQHGMAGFIGSGSTEKEHLLCLSAPQSSFKWLRKAASSADDPDPTTERRGLSMDEILAEVERERQEKGAPVAERLLGVPAHKRHAAVLEGLSYEAFENVQDTLDVSTGDLARIIGSSERTMRRRKESGTLSQQESDALVRVATAFERATRALDEARAVRWLTSPHPLLGGERALDLLRTSAGAEIVDEMLGSIEHGMPV